MLEDDPSATPPARLAGWSLGWSTVVLALLLALFLARAFLPGQVLLPLDIVTQQWPPWQAPGQVDQAHNPLLSDVVAYIYPVKEFSAAALRRGEFPLWNPYVLTGYPFIYNTQAGLFYPLSVLYLLFPAATAVDLTILLQMALGGLFMLLYLRALSLRPAAALAGAIIFLFNGLMVVWLQWQVVHAAVIWLPLQLLLIEKLAAARRAERRDQALAAGVGTAVALALPWLGGHWNWSLYVSLTGGAYLLARLGRDWWIAREPVRKLWPVVAVPAAALALSLVAVLPAVLFLTRSHRQELPLIESLRYGLLGRGVALLVPRFFGDPVTRTWWGFDNFNETTFYAGILPLLLALLAVLLRRDWHTRFFAVWGLLGLGWALGPLYGMLHILPIFGGLQPNRAAVLVVFCISVLAALGLDWLLRGRRAVRSTIAGILALLIGIVALYAFFYRDKVTETWGALGPQIAVFLLLLGGAALWLALAARRGARRPWLAGLALALIAADLFWFGYDYNPVTPLSDLYPPTAVEQYLRVDGAGARLVTPPEGLAYPPNSSLVPRLPNLSGYEPGLPQTLVAYVNAAEGGDAVRFTRKLQPLAGLNSPLLDALSVKYVVSSADVWGEPQPSAPRTAISRWAALPAEVAVADLPAGLQRIDVPLREAAEITLRVLSADGRYEFAHATAVPAPGDPWTSFYVDPFPAEWGGSFLLRIEGASEVGFDAGGTPLAQTWSLARPGLVFEDGRTRVYLRENYFPRAYYVAQGELVADAEAALARVVQEQERLREIVFLEQMGQDPPPELDFAAGAAALAVTREDLSGLDITAEVEQPGFLVLADAWYPGWQATVDGMPAAVYRANSVSRAVFLPAGMHAVQFRFRPLDFYLGAVVSGAAWTAVVVIFVWVLWRRSVRRDG